jgi:tetratricopeptide (TPR) repeat protein
VVLFGADSVLNRRKGFRYLLEALRQLPSADDDRELVLACFGHLPEDAAIQAPCRLLRMGHLADENHLALAYSAADVFVLPSLEDNLPNTVIESLACGVPVVAFNIGGIPEIIEHEQTGYLVDTCHPDELAEGIRWALSTDAFRRQAAQRCRRSAVRRYAANERAGDYLRLYTQLTAAGVREEQTLSAKDSGAISADLSVQIRTQLNQLAKTPGDIEALLSLGRLSLEAGQPDEAAVFYRQVIDQDPLNIQARNYYDDCYGFKPGELLQIQDPAEPYLVSAIVSTYNARQFIRGCLEDLAAQTIAARLEIIVVDSGSQQDERAVVAKMQRQHDNIVYIRTERETVYGAWNRGIQAARGKFITNANTDDRHSPDALERLAHILETNPDVVLVYADAIKTKTANERFGAHTPAGVFHWHDWDRDALLNKGCFIGPQPMWRRSVHDTYGFFDPEMVSSGDYEFWLRITQQAEQFFHLKMPLGLYLEREDSIEHASTAIRRKEDQRIVRMYRQAAARGRILGCRPADGRPEDSGTVESGSDAHINGNAAAAAALKGDTPMTTSNQSPYSPETEAALIAYMEEKLQSRVNAAVIHNDLGIMYCRTGEHPKALENFNAATDLDPENSLYLKNLADFYYSIQHDNRAALAVYKKLLTLDPVDITVLTILGHIHLAEKEVGQAKVYYRRILDLDPGNAEIQSYLENMGSAPQDVPAVQPADSADQLYEHVQVCMEQGDVQGACRQLEKLVAAYPEYALAHNDLGVLYYQTGNKDKALAAYQQAVALEPGNLTFKKNLADFKCIELKQVEEAVGLYNDILAAAPDDLETLTALGQVCAMLGKPEDARHFFNQALAVEPWNTEIRQMLDELDNEKQPAAAGPTAEQMHAEAKTLAEDGKPDQSLARLREVVAAYPDLAVGHNDLGVMLYQAGEKEAALRHYEQAVELDPDNAVFRKNRADFICLEKGRVEEAMQVYIDLLAQTPDDVEILTTLGQVCEHLEQMEDAQGFYQQALNVEPWNADIRQRLEALQNR